MALPSLRFDQFIDMPRILIADDRLKMRNTLRSLFEHYSRLEVCGEAEDGMQAVDTALALRPDVILLDYKMPNGTGIEAASKIREKLAEIPVVIFTLFKTKDWNQKRGALESGQ